MADIVYATAKYVRRSPQKARLVIDMIRGKNTEEASHILRFSKKSSALEIGKVLKSAVANATNNKEMDKSKLVVVEAYVNEAPTFRRGRAVSRGRYHQILKRNSHVTIGVSEQKTTESSTPKNKTARKKKAAPKSKTKKAPVKSKSKENKK